MVKSLGGVGSGMAVQYIATAENPFHLSVGAALISTNRQLLTLKRASGEYILPRGSMEAGETIEETLGRELLEETGFTGEPVAFLGAVISHFERGGEQVEKTTLYHLMEKPTRASSGPALGDDEQDSDIRWISEQDAYRLLSAQEAEIAKRAFRLISD